MPMRSLVPHSWGRTMPSEARRDPFTALQEEMNRLFESFGPFPASWSGGAAPRLDVCETDKEVDIEAELPGVDEKDVQVTLENDALVIKGEKKAEKEETQKGYRMSERSYGSFYRAIAVPPGVDPQKVEATFSKGVLKIILPKPTGDEAKTRKIEVKTS